MRTLKRVDNEFDLKQAELVGSVGCLCREVKYLVTQSVTHRPEALDIQDPNLLSLNLYLTRFPVLYKHITI